MNICAYDCCLSDELVEVGGIDEFALGRHSNFAPTLFFGESGFGGRSSFVADDEFGSPDPHGDHFNAQFFSRRRFEGRAFEYGFRLQCLDFFGDDAFADIANDVLVRRFAVGVPC